MLLARPRVIVMAVLGAALHLTASPGFAQDTVPPHLGGWVRSLGLPDLTLRHVGLTLTLDRLDGDYLGAQLRAGISRPIGSPISNLVAVQADVYGGVRDARPTWGLRPSVVSWFAGVGGGVDFDAMQRRADPFVMVQSPLRRGGFTGRGSVVRLDWYPTRRHGLSATMVQPLGRNHGRTRPRQDHVHLRRYQARQIDFDPDSELIGVLGDLARSGARINQYTVVPMGRRGFPPADELHRALAPIRANLAERSVDEELRHYHQLMDQAFGLAVCMDSPPLERPCDLAMEVATTARSLVLETVLFPYNRLLGQRKDEDTTTEFARHARGAFVRWLVRTSDVSADRAEAATFVFQSVLDIIEVTRATNRANWGDTRLVWLPLQLALRADDYARQEALDTLVSRAIGRRVQHGNRMWYVYNDRFLGRLVESIEEAEDYHLLWVHDFRGLTEEKRPDRLSLLTVTRSYMSALTRRVEAYDSVGRLPVYMLFLDQHYYEMRASRDLLAFLQDPLHHRLRLPGLSPEMADTIAAWQADLRRAVDGSQLLAAERAEYGERWLLRLVKVHVNVTNPADPSFRSAHILGFLGIPDDIMRDHRKAVLYDVTEADPYRGMAMYAGHGVGEHYATTGWEDRAIMIRGPTALTLRDAARYILEVHGFRHNEIPHVLRPAYRPLDYDARVQMEIDSMDAWGGVATRAIELHNSTGFGPKEIAVAQATVFSLTSPGGVLKVPDSLWLNELFASILGGAALRGTRVLPIAPSAASAPAPEFGLPGIHLVFSKLVALSQILGPEIEQAGGLLRPGFYHADVQVHDLSFRMASLKQGLERHHFLRDLYPSLYRLFQEMSPEPVAAGSPRAQLVAADPSSVGQDSVGPNPGGEFAKLHFKGFLYVSGEAWSRLIASDPLIHGLSVYLEERGRQVRAGAEVPEDEMAQALHVLGADVINRILEDVSEEERARWAFFLQIGSPNMDYRSMLLDGEVAVLVSGWTSLHGALDFLLLTGLVSWVETQAQIDGFIRPPRPVKRLITRWISLAL
jgi:hypothetical protein